MTSPCYSVPQEEDEQCGSTSRVDRQRVDCVRKCVWLWSNLSNTEQRGCLRLIERDASVAKSLKTYFGKYQRWPIKGRYSLDSAVVFMTQVPSDAERCSVVARQLVISLFHPAVSSILPLHSASHCDPA